MTNSHSIKMSSHNSLNEDIQTIKQLINNLKEKSQYDCYLSIFSIISFNSFALFITSLILILIHQKYFALRQTMVCRKHKCLKQTQDIQRPDLLKRNSKTESETKRVYDLSEEYHMKDKYQVKTQNKVKTKYQFV